MTGWRLRARASGSSRSAPGGAGRFFSTLLLAGGLALAATPAAAAPPAPDPTAWVADGPVYSIARLGDRTFIGGDFTRVGPRSGTGAKFSQSNGQRHVFPEVVGGQVRAVVGDGGGGWYIGGDFTHVGGAAREGLAHINPVGQVSGWTPGAVTGCSPTPCRAGVRALALHAGVLYVGGEFTKIGATSRSFVAALDAGSAGVLSWAPDVDGVVHTLAVAPVRISVGPTAATKVVKTMPLVFAGGDFTKFGTGGPAAVKAGIVWGVGAEKADGTGSNAASQAVAWSTSFSGTIRTMAVGPPVSDADVDKNTFPLYVGGAVDSTAGDDLVARKIEFPISGSTPPAPAAFGTWDGKPACDTSCTAELRSIAVSTDGTKVFAGGRFTSVGSTPPTKPWAGLAGFSGIRLKAGSAATPLSWSDPNAGDAVGGAVRAVSLSGDGQRLYAAGDFTQLAGVNRDRIAAVDPSTGAVSSSWNPGIGGGPVNALAANGSDVYAGGGFASAGPADPANPSGGLAVRNGLAAFNRGGVLDFGWQADATCSGAGCLDAVHAVAAYGDRVYVGGNFQAVRGQPRRRLAAVHATSGEVFPDFNPDPSSSCSGAGCTPPPTAVLALAATDTTVYVGGAFQSLGGQPRNNIGAVDAGSGGATGFNPGANDNVYTLSASCSTVYAGGAFTKLGGLDRNRIAAIDAGSGAPTPWDPNASSAVYSLAPAAGLIYAAGPFSFIGGQVRQKIAALSAATGTATAWNPSADYTVRAVAVSADGGTVYAGGSFNEVGGEPRAGLAAIDAGSGDAIGWNPGADGPVHALTAAGSSVYVGGAFQQAGPQMQQGFAPFTGDSSTGSPPAVCGTPEESRSVEPLPRPTARRDTRPPRIGRLRMTNRRFRVGRKRTAVGRKRTLTSAARQKRRKRTPVGTRFKYRLSEAATVGIRIERRRAGVRMARRVKGRKRVVCAKLSTWRRSVRRARRLGQTRQLRRLRRGKRCTRHKRTGALNRAGKRGANRTPFSGRIGRRALKPGRYRATLVARDAAGNRSKPARITFRVVRR